MCWGVEDELDPKSRHTPVVPELCQLTQRKLVAGREGGDYGGQSSGVFDDWKGPRIQSG